MYSFLLAMYLMIFFIENIYLIKVRYTEEEEPRINVTINVAINVNIIPSYKEYSLWSEQEVKWESGYVSYENRTLSFKKVVK